MSDAELCLAIDLGTGGPKIGLVGLDGAVLDFEHHGVATAFGDDGAATQDADEWWTLITGAARRLMARPGLARERVVAVAVTGQYASTVPVDANGRPTGPCLTWQDRRGGAHVRRAVGGPVQGYRPRALWRYVSRTGGAPSTSGADPVGQILYLTHDEPDVAARTRWFMEPVDYLTMRCTGVATATHASRFLVFMTDNRHLDRFAYDEGLAGLAGIDTAKLPPLVAFGSVVGSLTATAAAELGLREGVAVVTGMPDVHAAAVGSGATSLYQTHVALSTSSWISCPVPSKKLDAFHSIVTIPGLTNDSYLMLNNQESGAKSLEWLRSTLAGTGEPPSYDDLTAMAATSPPGSRGVTFAPWLAGERSPRDSRRVRGAFTSLSVTTTTPDLARAVMEGVAANSAWLLGYAERFAGRRLEPLRLLGGGATSRLWCQIFADTLARDVERVPAPMIAQLRGAALVAAAALGQRRLDEPVGVPGEKFSPNPDFADVYAARRDDLPKLFARERSWARRR
ncbi:MAG: xylulokinase [Acidimicrobiales bacterium]